MVCSRYFIVMSPIFHFNRRNLVVLHQFTVVLPVYEISRPRFKIFEVLIFKLKLYFLGYGIQWYILCMYVHYTGPEYKEIQNQKWI